jgi:tripartite-type tricarboxylate transporter receptor subunit TctC
LRQEIVKIGALPEVRDKLDTLGFIPVLSTPDEFGARIKVEMVKWGKVVRDAKLKIE